MSVALQRKQVPLTAWHLAEPADMIDALTAVSGQGWRGGVNCVDDVWRLELNADPDRQIIATLGDWLVDDMGLRLLTAAEVDDNYEVTE